MPTRKLRSHSVYQIFIPLVLIKDAKCARSERRQPVSSFP